MYHPPNSASHKALQAIREIVTRSAATTLEQFKSDLLKGLDEELVSPKAYVEHRRSPSKPSPR